MKKRLFAALLAGAVAISLMACGGSGSSSSSAPAADAGAAGTGEAAPAAAAEAGDGSYTIDVICKTLSSEYWSNMIQTDLGSGGYDGYIIAPLQADTVKTLIADTDAPVMALDSAIPSDKVISFIGTGNEEAAKAGAAAAVEAAKAAGWEEIKCIEIAGVQGDGTNTARMNGYIAGIEENGGDFLEDEVHYANAVADLATNEMEGIMSSHPEGIAIICANNDDMALAAANAAAKAGLETYKNTIFLGFDGQIPAAQAILDGKMTMSTAQNPYNMAYMAVETMVKYLNGEQVDPVVDSGYTIITKDNAQEHIDTLSSYGK